MANKGKEALMTRRIILIGISLCMLASCVVGPGPDGRLEVVPILPTVVELGAEPYYEHGGYVYFYSGDRWLYARSRSGPWTDLPRSHWPRETRRHNWDSRR